MGIKRAVLLLSGLTFISVHTAEGMCPHVSTCGPGHLQLPHCESGWDLGASTCTSRGGHASIKLYISIYIVLLGPQWPELWCAGIVRNSFSLVYFQLFSSFRKQNTELNAPVQ